MQGQQNVGVSDEYRTDKYMECLRHDHGHRAVQGAVATVRPPVHPTTPNMHPHVPLEQVAGGSQPQSRDPEAPGLARGEEARVDDASEALPGTARAAEVAGSSAEALGSVRGEPTWSGRGDAWWRANYWSVLCWAMAIIVLCVAVNVKMPRVVSFMAGAVRTNHL